MNIASGELCASQIAGPLTCSHCLARTGNIVCSCSFMSVRISHLVLAQSLLLLLYLFSFAFVKCISNVQLSSDSFCATVEQEVMDE